MKILAKLRPEPAREPFPPPKVYAPPREADTEDAAKALNSFVATKQGALSALPY